MGSLDELCPSGAARAFSANPGWFHHVVVSAGRACPHAVGQRLRRLGRASGDALEGVRVPHGLIAERVRTALAFLCTLTPVRRLRVSVVAGNTEVVVRLLSALHAALGDRVEIRCVAVNLSARSTSHSSTRPELLWAEVNALSRHRIPVGLDVVRRLSAALARLEHRAPKRLRFRTLSAHPVFAQPRSVIGAVCAARVSLLVEERIGAIRPDAAAHAALSVPVRVHIIARRSAGCTNSIVAAVLASDAVQEIWPWRLAPGDS